MPRNLVVYSSPLCVALPVKKYIPEIALSKLHLRGILERVCTPT